MKLMTYVLQGHHRGFKASYCGLILMNIHFRRNTKKLQCNLMKPPLGEKSVYYSDCLYIKHQKRTRK